MNPSRYALSALPVTTARRSDRSAASRFFFSCGLAQVLLLGWSACAFSQAPKQTTPPLTPKPQTSPTTTAVPAAPHGLDEADLSAFLDGLMPLTLERDDIAGAVVSVVKDGKILYAKGYGYADVKAKRPVVADSTMFRPGSISKLFTWTAVMQQVQQGNLDLDRDVNTYLDFKIPAKFDKPITLRDIMTHSAGFSETAKDLILTDSRDVMSLRTYLVNHLPERIYPPGTTPAYSNYATALAGYIVQRVSGLPFDQYVQKNVFEPLKMSHTTFQQPLPDTLKPFMSNGYTVASKDAKPYEFIPPYPAGSVATTGVDMAHFMIAHLQGGEYEGARILDPKTVELMHTRQRSPGNVPSLNAMALGFYEETRNGHRIIGHGGDTVLFHSDLHLIPDANVGFFVSYNSQGKGTLDNRTALWQEFLDRYFPYQVPPATEIASAAQDGEKVAGQYIVSRRIQGNFLNPLAMVGEEKISLNPDHTISVEGLHGRNNEPRKFVEIAPLVYRSVDGQEKVAFYQGYDGRMTAGIDYPFMVFQKAGLLESKYFNLTLIFFALGAMTLTLLFWPIAAMMRKHYGRRLLLTPLDRRLRLVTRLTCVAYLVALVLMVSVVNKLGELGGNTASMDLMIRLALFLCVFAIIGSLLAGWYAVRAWRAASVNAPVAEEDPEPGNTPAVTRSQFAPHRWLWGRLSWTVAAAGCIAFTYLLLYWGVLNFKLNY